MRASGYDTTPGKFLWLFLLSCRFPDSSHLERVSHRNRYGRWILSLSGRYLPNRLNFRNWPPHDRLKLPSKHGPSLEHPPNQHFVSHQIDIRCNSLSNFQ